MQLVVRLYGDVEMAFFFFFFCLYVDRPIFFFMIICKYFLESWTFGKRATLVPFSG